MAVRDWMTIDPITVGPETPVRVARTLMRDNGIRHLPVIDGDRLVGIVSDHDVRIDDASLHQLEALERIAEVVGEAKPVEAIMTESVHTLSADASVGDAARLMLSRRISAVPVTDDDGLLEGIITTTDCLLAALTDDPELELSAAVDAT